MKRPEKISLNILLRSGYVQKITLVVPVQYDRAEENGIYAPVTEDHEFLPDEAKGFRGGEQFPDDRGWIWVGE